uniref:Uncharacterized protein n=1 Tax=Glossina brevipalpis TaxID=37001 RepID=A0A1A9WSF2_9MUSC
MDDYGFQSIRQRYKGLEEQDLHLEIQEYGNGVLEKSLYFVMTLAYEYMQKHFFSKNNCFMAISSIHDIAINEVLENRANCGNLCSTVAKAEFLQFVAIFYLYNKNQTSASLLQKKNV